MNEPSNSPDLIFARPKSSIFTPSASGRDRKSTRLNSSHLGISYAVFCLKKKNHPEELEHEAPARSGRAVAPIVADEPAVGVTVQVVLGQRADAAPVCSQVAQCGGVAGLP